MKWYEDPKSAAKIRALRAFGVPYTDVRGLMDKTAGDILLAAGYSLYSTYAVNVKTDREAWNMKRAQEFADSHQYDEQSESIIARTH
ncbi:hypothetical protein RYA05_00750 [Pseudomonas syringae pv. actinidiae]|nr:hypothetical protein [Pseudomonas syringae pv. actinidiae]